MYRFSRFLLLFLLMGLAPPVPAEPYCPAPAGRAPSALSVRPPASVLLVPLLRAQPDTQERETWPVQPAARISAFYRQRFGARPEWLNGVRTWEDFFRKTERLQQRGERFDRVILIGHGGFDGPLLNDALIRNERTIEGTQGRALRVLEAQPGIQNVLELSYDLAHNPAFGAAFAASWDRLGLEDPATVVALLTELETRYEPPDPACLQRLCPVPGTAAGADRTGRPISRAACESVCRYPLFVARTGEREAPERFLRFAESLRDLTRPGGLILIGSCNPGTTPPGQRSPWDIAGMLTRSTLAGGPHDSYVQLLAAATGHTVAGPIGKTSAADIVDRVRLFEYGHPQRYLRIAAPPACPGSQ